MKDLFKKIWKKSVTFLVLIAFFLNTLIFSSPATAQMLSTLPVPGTIVPASPMHEPVMMKGLLVYPEDPLKVGFVIDRSGAGSDDEAFREQCQKMIRYFFAALTVPDEDMWVNLSPYERDRVIPEKFSYTDMGVDLLAQDYLLKQLASSMTYPEADVGRAFWNEIYARRGGMSDTAAALSKVWVVPQEAEVYVSRQGAFIVDSRMDVLLDRDYQASTKNDRRDAASENGADSVYLDVYREKILPRIKKDVNEGEQFTALRQIYSATVLAVWFKKNLRRNILSAVYTGKNVVDGIEVSDKEFKTKLYERYIESFRKGAYNYIKEEYDQKTGDVVPVKHFSGGVQLTDLGAVAGSVFRQSADPDRAQSIHLADPVIVDVKVSLGWDGKPLPEGLGGQLAAVATQGVSSGMLLPQEGSSAAVPVAVVPAEDGAFLFQKPAAVAAEDRSVSTAHPQERRRPFSFRRTVTSAMFVVGIFLGTFLAVPAAQGASFERTDDGNIVAVVKRGDTFGHIVEQMRVAYKAADKESYLKSDLYGPMWGREGAVRKVSKQASGVKNVEVIGMGSRIVLPKDIVSPEAVQALVPSSKAPAVKTAAVQGPLAVKVSPVQEAPAVQPEVTPPTESTVSQDVSREIGSASASASGQALAPAFEPVLSAPPPAVTPEVAPAPAPVLAPVVVKEAPAGVVPSEPAGETVSTHELPLAHETVPAVSPEKVTQVDGGIFARAAEMLSRIPGHQGLGWFQGLAAIGLFALTLLRLASGHAAPAGSGGGDDPRRKALTAFMKKRLEGMTGYQGYLHQRALALTAPLTGMFLARLASAGVSLDDKDKEVVALQFNRHIGAHLEKALAGQAASEAWQARITARARELADRYKDPRGREAEITAAMEDAVRDDILPAIDAEIGRAAQHVEEILFSDARRKVYEKAFVMHAERLKLYRKGLTAAEGARAAALNVLEFMGTESQPAGELSPEDFWDGQDPGAFAPVEVRQQPVKGYRLWREDLMITAATAGMALVSGSDGPGMWLATGLSPFIYRLGLAAALWFHEMGHLLRAGSQAFTAKNVMGNIGVRDWLRMLVPFFGTVPEQGRLKVDVYDTASPGEDVSIRRAGFWASLIFAGAQLFAAHTAALSETVMMFPFSMGAVWAILQAVKSDLFDQWTGKTCRGAYACGVAAIVKPRQAGDRGLVSGSARLQFERMGERTDIRGQQAAGVKVITQDKRGRGFLVGTRVLNKKRGKLPRALDKELSSALAKAGRSGLRANNGPDILLGHYRYGTSSAPAVNETHPHQWMSERVLPVWSLQEGTLVREDKTLGIAIGHNGDFDNLWWYGEWVPNGVVGLWLERVLHTSNSTKGDSPKIAGVMDLMVTQGIWSASARLGYYQEISSSLRDVFGGSDPSKEAPDTALSDEDIKALGRVFETAFQDVTPRILLPQARSLGDLWVTAEEAAAHPELAAQYQKLKDLETDVAGRLGTLALCQGWGEEKRKAFAHRTIEDFFENDLNMSVRKFMDLTDHPANTFGLVTGSTLKTSGLVLAARGQPMVIGVDQETGTVLAASEPAAVRARDNENYSPTDRFVLDQRFRGEIVEISENPDEKTPLKVYSRDLGRELSADEVLARYERLRNNPYIRPMPQSDPDDPVGKDIRDIPSVLETIRQDWQNADSWNSQTADQLMLQLVQKSIEKKIRAHSELYGQITRRLARTADELAVRESAADDVFLQQEDARTFFPFGITTPANELAVKGLLHKVFPRADIDREIGRWALQRAGQIIDGSLNEDTLWADLKEYVHTTLDRRIASSIVTAQRKAEDFFQRSAAYRRSRLGMVVETARFRAGIPEEEMRGLLNAQLTAAFKEAGVEPDEPTVSEGADLVIGGIEISLWISEQFAADMRRLFPDLKIVVTSSNKILEDPRAQGIGNNTIVLLVSHSGQTFGTLNSAITLGGQDTDDQDEGDMYLAAEKVEKLFAGRTFVLTGEVDTFMARAVGQRFQADAPFSRRIFTNMSGFRPAEASTVTGVATYATMTEILLRLGDKMGRLFPQRQSFRLGLRSTDLEALRTMRDDLIEQTERVVGTDREGRPRTSDENKDILKNSDRWARHVLDVPFAKVLTYIHLYSAVIGGFLVADQLTALSPWPIPSLLTHHLQLAVFLFFSSVTIWAKRLWDGRTVFARTGNRTIVVGGPPVVHQSLELFISKLFSLSKASTAVEVHGANADDHMVHRFGHRIVRGVLIWMGIPDGRMAKLQGMSAASMMTAKQAMGVQNMGVGAEVYTVGWERARNPNASFADTVIAGPPATDQEDLQVLYHNRFGSLLQLVAGQVFFWNMAKKVSTLGLPVSARQFWPWWWPMHRTQSGTRIATTASPKSPSSSSGDDGKGTGAIGSALLEQGAADAAMNGEAPGGVDMSARYLDLKETGRTDAADVPAGIPSDGQPINSLKPFILQIRPVSSAGMLLLLGLGRSDQGITSRAVSI